MRIAFVSFFLLLTTAASFAQSGTSGSGGTGGMGGVSSIGAPATVTPPPSPTVPQSLFGGSFNKAAISWPPLDGAGNKMLMNSCRIWDDGMKVGQIVTVSGPVGNHTYSFNFAPFDNMIQSRCKKIASPTAPLAPLKVIYTMGDTPAGAALAGSISVGSCGGVAGCCSPDTVNSCRAYDDNVSGDPVTDTDTTVKTYVSNLIAHEAGQNLQIDAWEIQNEADTPGFQCWNGAGCGGGANPNTTVNAAMLKALVRRGWDMKQIINCKTPTAVIYSWSPHTATITPGTIFDNFLNSTITSRALTPGIEGYPADCPAVPSQTVHGYDVFDVMNWHADGGGAFNGTNSPETLVTTTANLQTEYAARAAAGHPLQTPFVCDECGYRNGETTTDDERAGNVSRRYILAGFLGYNELDWYQLDTSGIGLVGAQQGTAYDVTRGWLVGSILAPYVAPVGTIYTETVTLGATGNQELLIWDANASNANGGYTCNNNIGGAGCTTVNVPNTYTKFTSLDGVMHSIVANQVPASGKPICVSTGPCI
jgi:hypothetical protein